MEGFLQKLRITLRDRIGFTAGGLVVAVSGGLDSMVLLHALAMLRSKFGWSLAVAHCHHGLRGRAADLDASLVEKTAGELGIPHVRGQIEVRRAAEASGESVEMAARRLRHAFLARTARTAGATHIALAHHADDQAELLLLRLLRGTGSEGLGGMRIIAPSPADAGITLLRPLLGFSRSEIAAFAAKHQIRFREDRTNRDLSIPRNRVRHRLIPHLVTHYNPSLPRVLARLAEIAGAEADFLRDETARLRGGKKPKEFALLHVALQRTILREELWELGHAADFETVERFRLARLLPKRSDSGACRNPAAALPSAPAIQETRVKFSGRQGTVRIGDVLLRWKIRRRPLPFEAECEQFDADLIGPVAVLRARRSGDRFQPLGMARPARLQNIFVNRRVPADERGRRLILESGSGEIAWVEGLPPGELFKITGRTRRILIVDTVLRRGE